MQTIVRRLLQDALLVYKATVLLLHRARILLKCMGLLWKDGNINGGLGETCWTTEHLGEEVLKLRYFFASFLPLDVIISPFQDLGHDSAFVAFR